MTAVRIMDTPSRGVTLVETMMVIVLMAAITPVLAHLLTAASAAHHDASSRRAGASDVQYAIDTAGARLRLALADPEITITEASDSAITLSDGTSVRREGGQLLATADGLPEGTLTNNASGFVIEYADAAGVSVDPIAPGFDESTIARVGLSLTTDFGVTVTDRVYREGVRTYASTGSVLEWGVVAAGAGWTTVDLTGEYEDMIVVCTPERTSNAAPLVARVRNASGSSFELRLQNPGDRDVVGADRVHYIVAERGAYDAGGTRFEADRVPSSRTNHKRDWGLPPIVAYQHAYTSPVVIGQIMTSNDARWSTFWASGSSRSRAPDRNNLRVGLHVGEDAQRTRASEEIGYIVFESGAASIGSTEFEATLTPDVVTHRPNTRSFRRAFLNAGSTVAVASMSAVDGGDGGFVTILGEPGDAHVVLRIDEDQIGDNERSHTTEEVAFISFDAPGSWDGQ